MTTPRTEVGADGVPVGYPFKPQYEIAPRDAEALIKAGSCIVVDCRTDAEWETARLEPATLIPLHELEMRIDEIEAEPDATVLTLCHHGRRSLTAAMILQNRGFPNTRSIVGGIELWSQHIDPSIPRYTKDGGVCTLVS